VNSVPSFDFAQDGVCGKSESVFFLSCFLYSVFCMLASLCYQAFNFCLSLIEKMTKELIAAALLGRLL
jgi:hypothetical protein